MVGLVRGRRQCFVCPPLRITLDVDLEYHAPPERRCAGATGPGPEPADEPVFKEPRAVLEVKRTGPLPDRASRFLAPLEPRPYSKFRSLLKCLASAL